MNDLVDNDSFNGFLFPVLLALEVMIGHDSCAMGESRAVCESSGHDGWNVEMSVHVCCNADD
jgi:hypothetical protein